MVAQRPRYGGRAGGGVRRGWKIQTVSTFLTRLVDKGMLTCEKHGGQNLYRVAVSEADYRAGETRDFLREVHGGSVQSFFAALGSPGSLSGAEIEELRRWLDGEGAK